MLMAAQDLQFPSAGCIPQPGGLVQLAVTTVLPSGENSALVTSSSWPRKTCSWLPLITSHSRPVLSCENTPPLAVTTVLPSEENCALMTRPSWPRKTCSCLPLVTSHSRAVLSLKKRSPLAVTTVLPSGENCALLTQSS